MNTDDLPKTLLEAVNYFADEARAHDCLVQMRWPDGVQCAHCQSVKIGKLSVSVIAGKNGKPDKTRRIWNCKACKRQFTAKVGTIFEDSPLPLSKWLPAIWLVVNAKNGISSHELSRSLGVTQKSAWHMSHRIRIAIQRGGGVINKFSGVVEVDESYIGGLARNMHKDRREQVIKTRGTATKTPVMGLLERHAEKGKSQVITKVVANTKSHTLISTIARHVESGSEIHTDAYRAYWPMPQQYVHKFIDHAECYAKDGVSTNGLENYWSLLKRGLKGTHTHVAPFHLFRYLDDQTFRFNERAGGDHMRFAEALRTVKDRHLPYKKLTGKLPKRKD